MNEYIYEALNTYQRPNEDGLFQKQVWTRRMRKSKWEKNKKRQLIKR